MGGQELGAVRNRRETTHERMIEFVRRPPTAVAPITERRRVVLEVKEEGTGLVSNHPEAKRRVYAYMHS